MDIEILEDIGLSKREINVYVALIELGESNAGPLKHKTHLQNSVIHWCLNNLTSKGLVNYVKKGNRKYYQATDPENLIKFLNEKRRRLQDLIPQLIKKQGKQTTYQVHIYEGAKGLRAIHEDILKELKKDEEFVIIGAPKEAHEKFEAFFLDFHKRRQKLNIRLRCMYNHNAKQYAEIRKEMKNTQVKYMPQDVSAPTWTTIYNNKTILLVVGDVILGIVIENESIAKNFKTYFELLWKIAKK